MTLLSRRFRPALEPLEGRLVFDVTIGIDAAAGLHLIDPNIYGTAFADAAALDDLNAPLNRHGGNTTTRYNWQLNASNRANDWFFESIADGPAVAGAAADSFIGDAFSSGAQASITIPTIGWVATLAANRDKLASFSVVKYGAQQATDVWMPDAGNGVRTNGQFVTGNDRTDANVAVDVAFQRAWVQHLIAEWGAANAGGVRYYNMDNEPSIWHSTHRDVHPVGATMEEVRDRFIAHAAAIKALDPNAQILGPEEWGWSGYLYSGYDQQYGSQHGWGFLPDRAAHGNMDYLPWLLDQIRQHDAGTGQRLMDYFTAHYYPQSGEFSDTVSQSMQLLRNRSTRSLWDPNYTDASWIDDEVRLIPRLQGWVDQYYPGTKVGITEYNWGAEGHMNGATTQADIYGIFGREDLDLANRWTTPATNSPTYLAMKMYRNYDGNDSTFGETSVAATVANPDQVSAYAALRADGALTVMVVNKNLYAPGASTTITVNVGNFESDGVARPWQLAATNGAAQTQAQITHLSDVVMSGNSFTMTVPMQSVTLFVLEPGEDQPPAAPGNPSATAGDGRVTLNWSAATGATSYNVYRATTSNGQGATPYRTGIAGTSFVDTGATNGTTYYYKVTAVNNAGESVRSAEVSARPGTPFGTAIDAGGGPVWGYRADGYFVGGQPVATTHAIAVAGVSNAAPQAVYKTWRAGNFTYAVPGLTPNAAYAVRLHFAENTASRAGERLFHVNVNGARVLNRLDVFAAAGGNFKALTRTVHVRATPAGTLAIQFQTVAGHARVNGIEVSRLPVVALDAGGGGPVAEYRADGYFSGGATRRTTAWIDTGGVAGSAPMAVYQSERYGTFGYTIPNLVAGQSYLLRLDFVETMLTAANQRRFHVRIDGGEVLTNFDVFAAAGGRNRAVRRQFAVLADANGQIVLNFVGVLRPAIVSGIAIV